MAHLTSVESRPCRVGVAGTGFLGQGLLTLLHQAADFAVSKVLTRRPLDQVPGVDTELLTHSREELVEQCDLVVECSGDVYHAADTVWAAHAAGLPVVTMNTEFHVTVGSYFVESGILTEGEGDQPGSLAALREEVLSMGFEPLVYGNIKGFLNHEPTPEDMDYWSKKNGISLTQVTSFTDGTKLQAEQALVANGLGAGILERGLVGPEDLNFAETAEELGPRAEATGGAVSDYVLNGKLPAGVFITAKHPCAAPEVLRYLKMGDGPYYTLHRPYHLCQFEMMRTLRRVVAGGSILLNNSSLPKVQVVAVAKRDLEAGDRIDHAMGGFAVRGEVAYFQAEPGSVPIGLLDGARLMRPIEKGQSLSWDDVEVREGVAREAASRIAERVAGTRGSSRQGEATAA